MKHIVVIDPAVMTPELDCFNALSSMSPVPLSYHLPAMYGLNTLPQSFENVLGVIMLGSHSSVLERLPWQLELIKWLEQYFACNKPFLGICFGHQLLGHMFGAPVGYILPSQDKLIGVRECKVQLNELKISGNYSYIVSHNQGVLEIPREFKVTMTSDINAIEGMKHQSKPIFSVQAHPEATKNFINSRQIVVPQDSSALLDGKNFMTQFFKFILEFN